tara:strand:+ start:1622 stop:2140 length:519 start_codon:yes stop_codon:yes gene_type:complete
MAKSVKCCLCDQPATVHLTQIINNKMLKVDLCEACASEKGLIGAQVPPGFSFEEVLKNHELHPIDATKSKVKCDECGLDFSDLQTNGRLGCEHCFTVFKQPLAGMIQDMHFGQKHVGKVPEQSLASLNSRMKLLQLQAALSEAIETEAYEDAAKYRDQINHCKALVETESIS